MDAGQRHQLLGRAALAGTVLVLVVIVMSAFLRLVQFGVGCEDWPSCYGAVQRVAGSEHPAYAALVPWMRATHRLAAMGVSVAALVVAATAWTAARRRAVFPQAVALLALTLFLAILGRMTPGSQIPAVTLGNVLGGMAMLALFWWLRLEALAIRRAGTPGLALAGAVGLLLVALQFGLGTLVSANHASAACPGFPDCGAGAAAAWDIGALDPWRLAGGTVQDPARQTLNMAHRWGAWITVIYLAWLATLWWRHGIGRRVLIIVSAGLLIAQFALGVSVVLLDVPLVATIAHNTLAGILILVLLTLVFQSRLADATPVSAACQMTISK